MVLEAAVLLEAGWDHSVHEVWSTFVPRDEVSTWFFILHTACLFSSLILILAVIIIYVWSVYVSVLFQVFDTTHISECPRGKNKSC